MALKADVVYRGTSLSGAVFQVGTMTLMIASDGGSGTLSFPVLTWLSQSSYVAGEQHSAVPEWQSNEMNWDPAGAAPLVQAYAFVTAKLQAGGATNIVEV